MSINQFNNIYKKKIYFTLIILTSISFFICLLAQFNDGKYNYFEQWVLPISFLLCLIMFKNNSKYLTKYSVMIINILMFIRYSILPISYYYTYGDVIKYYENLPIAIILMIYEMMAVFIVIEVVSPRVFKNTKINDKCDCELNKNDFFKIGTIIISILFAVTLIKYPQYIRQLSNFSFDMIESIEIESSVNGFYNLLYKTGIVTLACTLLSKISRNEVRKKKKGRLFFISFILVIVIIWMSSQGTSGGISRTSFLTNCIIFFIILIQIYPSKFKLIVKIGVICTLIFLLSGTITRFSYGESLNLISIKNAINEIFNYEIMNAYFGGVENVSVAIEMCDRYSYEITIKTLFNDIFAGVPYLATRMNIDFNDRIVTYFNGAFFGYLGLTSRICPIIGQGLAYFGFVLSPIFTVISVYFALKINSYFNNSSDKLVFYCKALMVYFLACYSMYNVNILFNGIWNKILPILVVIFLNKIFKKKKLKDINHMKGDGKFEKGEKCFIKY